MVNFLACLDLEQDISFLDKHSSWQMKTIVFCLFIAQRVISPEGWLSGWKRRSWKPLSVTAPWVRILLPPPFFQHTNRLLNNYHLCWAIFRFAGYARRRWRRCTLALRAAGNAADSENLESPLWFQILLKKRKKFPFNSIGVKPNRFLEQKTK